MTTSPRTSELRAALEADPYGDVTDDAWAADLRMSSRTVAVLRRQWGIPTAQARRRRAPGARMIVCPDCGRERMVDRSHQGRACLCGRRLETP